jgi:hypothetical protein
MPFYMKIAKIYKKLVIVAYNYHSCLTCVQNSGFIHRLSGET